MSVTNNSWSKDVGRILNTNHMTVIDAGLSIVFPAIKQSYKFSKLKNNQN